MKTGLLAKAHGVSTATRRKKPKVKPPQIWPAAPMVILIPQPTPSLNQLLSMHWAKKARMQGEFVKAIRAAMLFAQPPMQRVVDPEPRSLAITRYGSRELDDDNLRGGCKPLVDALVACGLAWDDSPQWLTVVYRQVKCARKDCRTEVEL